MEKILAPSILAGNHAHLTSALKMAEMMGENDSFGYYGWTFCA